MWNLRNALAECNARKEKPLLLIDVARELWPESDIDSQRVSISRLMRPETKSVKIDHVKKICNLLGCEPNKLFKI